MGAPTGVKVVSILYYLSAFGKGMLGIGIMMFGSVIATFLSFLGFIGVPIIVVGAVLLFLGILDFIVGINLWKGQSWARYAAIFLSLSYVIWALIEMYFGDFIDSWIILIIHGAIAGYLLFDKDSRKYFD